MSRWTTVTVVERSKKRRSGVPLGLIAGRLAWRAFADQLGVVPSADIPLRWLGVVVMAAVALGLLAALVPGRAAARIRPSVVLRETA